METIPHPRHSLPKLKLSLGIPLFSFCFFFLILLCAPMSYDDYEFAALPASSLQEIVKFCLSYGNGRLLGNIGVVLMLQSPLLSALAKALVLAGFVYLLPTVLGLTDPIAFGLTFLLIAATDSSLFAQTITWTSGFQNYLPPIFLSLLILYLLEKYSKYRGKLSHFLLCAVIFLLSVAAQLFVEHSCVIHVALALVTVVKASTDPKKQGRVPSWLFLLGSILGLALMLWIPKAFYLEGNHTEGYRSAHFESLTALVFCVARNFLRLTNHYFGLLGLPLCAGALISVFFTASARSSRANRLMTLLPLLSGGFMLVNVLFDSYGWYAEPALLHQVLAMVAVLIPLGVWILALLGETDALFRNRELTLLLLAMFSLAPLLVLTPIHIRVVYHSQIFVSMAFLLSASRFLAQVTESRRRTIEKVLLAAAGCVCLCLGSVFLSIHSMNQMRDRYIRQELAQGAETIETFRIPFDYVHEYTDPCMNLYYYRHEPKDVSFEILVYDSWLQHHGG